MRRRFDRHDAATLLVVVGGGAAALAGWIVVSHQATSYTGSGLARPLAYLAAALPQLAVAALLVDMARCMVTDAASEIRLRVVAFAAGLCLVPAALLPVAVAAYPWHDIDPVVRGLPWVLMTLALHAVAGTVFVLAAWLLTPQEKGCK